MGVSAVGVAVRSGEPMASDWPPTHGCTGRKRREMVAKIWSGFMEGRVRGAVMGCVEIHCIGLTAVPVPKQAGQFGSGPEVSALLHI